MTKNKRTIYFIVGITILIAALFISAIIKLYANTLHDAKESHQLQQLEMIRTAETGLNFYMKHLVEDLNFISYYLAKQDIKNILANNANLLIRHYEDEDIKSVIYFDEKNSVIFLKGYILPLDLKNQLFDLVSERKLEPNKSWFSNVLPLDKNKLTEDLYFVIVVPVFANNNSSNSGKDNNNFGLVGLVIDFNNLMNKFITPLKLNQSDFAWMLDGKGRLIYHPRHNDMLFKSILDSEAECKECHNSFETQREMLIKENYIGEYIVSGEPIKIMASKSIKFSNESWILAISTFLPEITESLRERFRYFFILGIMILFIIFLFGGLLYLSNARRIRAEDETRILEQRQAFQDELNHYAKLASMGELVDSVAHEINTPLGIISAHTDVLNLNKEFPDQYREELSIIKNQTKRINNYTKTLLSYSHRMPYQPRLYLLSEIIDECLYLLQPRFREKNIKLTKKFDKKIQYVNLDRGQIEQVFFNCINNSIDAINHNHGEIKISTLYNIDSNSSIEDPKKGCVSVIIRDNGCGIEKDDLDKVFNPFYSTKLPDKGTGLGLSITKAILNRHKAKIEISSIFNEYTSVKITLPLQEDYC